MQKYFTKSVNGEITNFDDIKHIQKVMRMKIGQQIKISDQKNDYIAEITAINKNDVKYTVIKKVINDSEMSSAIAIGISLLKGDKIDLVVQKSTELGAAEIILFKSQYTVTNWDDKIDKKILRLQKIAKEAAEQANRLIIPTIRFSENIWQEKYPLKLLAYEKAKMMIQPNKFLFDQSALIVIGPEGGFSLDEVKLAKENQFQIISLGTRILRAETAPLYALAQIDTINSLNINK